MPNAIAISPAGIALVQRFQAESATLDAEMAAAVDAVRSAVLVDVTQAQFDALASLALSIGPDAFAGCDVVAHLNAGAVIAAADAFEADRPDLAAARRRAAEKALFLSDDAPAPGPAPEKADETAARLKLILAAEPQTAHVLSPPPPPLEDDTPATYWAPARARSTDAQSQGERFALASLCAVGLGLIGFSAIGLAVAAPSDFGVLALAAAPGLVALGVVAHMTLGRPLTAA